MRDAEPRRSSVVGRRLLGLSRSGDGTELSVAVLSMQRGDKLVSVTVRSADGGSLTCRLGPLSARRILELLTAAISEAYGTEVP